VIIIIDNHLYLNKYHHRHQAIISLIKQKCKAKQTERDSIKLVMQPNMYTENKALIALLTANVKLVVKWEGSDNKVTV
jgi:hypothetical protein